MSDHVFVSAEEVRKTFLQEAREERIERYRKGLALLGITTEDDENATDQHGGPVIVTETADGSRMFYHALDAQAKNRLSIPLSDRASIEFRNIVEAGKKTKCNYTWIWLKIDFVLGDIKYVCNVMHQKPKEGNTDTSAPTGRPTRALPEADPHFKKRHLWRPY